MTDKLSNMTLTYTAKNGQVKTKTIKVEKGLEIPFYENGYYINSYHVNDKGQTVAKYGPKGHNQVIKQIETVEAEINRLTHIQNNNKNDGGLTKKDFDIEDEKQAKRNAAELMNSGVVPFNVRHPILSKVLPKCLQW